MSTNRLFDALAARPDDAVVLRSATSVWTSKAVRDEVERLTARLAGARVVALLADNSPEWALTDLAALHAGVVLLRLHQPGNALRQGTWLAGRLWRQSEGRGTVQEIAGDQSRRN